MAVKWIIQVKKAQMSYDDGRGRLDNARVGGGRTRIWTRHDMERILRRRSRDEAELPAT